VLKLNRKLSKDRKKKREGRMGGFVVIGKVKR
jgi:hypothetical protein